MILQVTIAGEYSHFSPPDTRHRLRTAAGHLGTLALVRQIDAVGQPQSDSHGLHNPAMLPTMLDSISIRRALASEREYLEALQRRASLANAGDREAILAHPDAIDIPIDQLESGQVYVAAQGETIVGFAAILARLDGDTELDALFVEPSMWRQGIGRRLLKHCQDAARSDPAPCTSSATRTPESSILRVDSKQ